MEKTIFNVYVEMESQEQCDKMKQLCVDNGLEYWSHQCGFNYLKNEGNYFESNHGTEFVVYDNVVQNKTKVTETKFIELLKQYKNE